LDQFKTLPLKNNNDIYYKLMVTQKNQNFIFKTISFVEFNGKEKILGLTQIHATKNSTVEIVREGNGKFSLFIRPVD
jgi:hypothetical protein